jgi:hypothetical protein
MLRLKTALRMGVALLALAVTLGVASPAQAGTIVIILDEVDKGSNVHNTAFATGTTSAVISPLPITLGNFTINAASATNAMSTPSLADLDTTAGVVSTVGGTLTITAYSTDYPALGAGGDMFSQIGGTILNGTITAQSFFDGSNTGNTMAPPAFGLPAGATLGLNFVTTSSPFAASHHDPVNSSAPFALINQEQFSFQGAGSASFDQETTVTATAAVPAPASVILALCGGLPCMGISYLRRRRQVQVA